MPKSSEQVTEQINNCNRFLRTFSVTVLLIVLLAACEQYNGNNFNPDNTQKNPITTVEPGPATQETSDYPTSDEQILANIIDQLNERLRPYRLQVTNLSTSLGIQVEYTGPLQRLPVPGELLTSDSLDLPPDISGFDSFGEVQNSHNLSPTHTAIVEDVRGIKSYWVLMPLDEAITGGHIDKEYLDALEEARRLNIIPGGMLSIQATIQPQPSNP